MSEEPYPLVELSEALYVRQVRAIWYSASEKQTYIRVDDHCSLVVAGNRADELAAKWQEKTR